MDVEAVSVRVREDAVDVAATGQDQVGEPEHLGSVEETIEVGLHRDAVVAVQGRELPFG